MVITIISCDYHVSSPENQLARAEGNVAINMNYNMKKTSFQIWNSPKQATSHIEINRTIPIVSKEKVELNIFQNGEAELLIETLPHNENFFSTKSRRSGQSS